MEACAEKRFDPYFDLDRGTCILFGDGAGAAVVENVFNINGMGSLMVQCITKRDFQLVQACILLLSAVTCVCNLLVDIAYAYVDPRIRLK